MVNSVVLQEIIQNADDARATEVKFFLRLNLSITNAPTWTSDRY